MNHRDEQIIKKRENQSGHSHGCPALDTEKGMDKSWITL